MSKYYRLCEETEPHKGCEAINAVPIEVDDILRAEFPYKQSIDPWHSASEPPKPEDFEPTLRVLALYDDGMPLTVRNTDWNHKLVTKGVTHWRKITPPCQG